jgi:hypothetical protein
MLRHDFSTSPYKAAPKENNRHGQAFLDRWMPMMKPGRKD